MINELQISLVESEKFKCQCSFCTNESLYTNLGDKHKAPF